MAGGSGGRVRRLRGFWLKVPDNPTEVRFIPRPYPTVDLIPRGPTALAEEMWRKFCIRYSTRGREEACLVVGKFFQENICEPKFSMVFAIRGNWLPWIFVRPFVPDFTAINWPSLGKFRATWKTRKTRNFNPFEWGFWVGYSVNRWNKVKWIFGEQFINKQGRLYRFEFYLNWKMW